MIKEFDLPVPTRDGVTLRVDVAENLKVGQPGALKTLGVAGETSVEYILSHVCSSKTVLHKVFHNAEYPAHLLLPVFPRP